MLCLSMCTKKTLVILPRQVNGAFWAPTKFMYPKYYKDSNETFLFLGSVGRLGSTKIFCNFAKGSFTNYVDENVGRWYWKCQLYTDFPLYQGR